MLNLFKSTPSTAPPPPSPPGRAVSPPVIDPERFEDFPCFRETFCVYFPDATANARLRGFGHLLFEMVLETWGQWPDHPEGIFPNELRAAVADMRHLQGAMSSWCGPAFSPSSEYESRVAGVGAEIALAIGELADRLEVELDSWLGKVS
ncbi:MAG TPA: hypothetical protein VF173_34620 [Thermoanaerobaculia bacterium]|nr:hypothetical protein [Thermoanaerobaculia bacterium]